MPQIGKLISYLLWTVLILLTLTIMLGSILLLKKNEIKSTKPIQPQIEIIVEDNKVDTIYVYSKP